MAAPAKLDTNIQHDTGSPSVVLVTEKTSCQLEGCGGRLGKVVDVKLDIK
jgi:hypothetical protein